MNSKRSPSERGLRLPFFYGWVILLCACCASFSRQGPAVSTLSIFITPMTDEFGWSRTAISAAVSLGGILAAVVSPMLGPMLDRYGARVMLSYAVLSTGLATIALAFTPSLSFFLAVFCFARMNFAGPFDLGIYGAVNNWFLRRRGVAMSVVTAAAMAGLIAMPLIAQAAILYEGWRAGWLAVGATVLIVGFLPNWLLMVRRPEDMGLSPDGDVRSSSDDAIGPVRPRPVEPTFTRAEAVRTSTFWTLSIFTLLVFPVQAGVSLHQAPHLIERGIDPTTAALIVSAFSLSSAISGIGSGLVVRRITVRGGLAASALLLGLGAAAMLRIEAAADGYLAAVLFGCGIGGILTILPIAWADYFGRRSYGAIRGVALTFQVVSQASGPLISGILHDLTGNYVLAFLVFTGFAALAVLVALITRPPRQPVLASVADRAG